MDGGGLGQLGKGLFENVSDKVAQLRPLPTRRFSKRNCVAFGFRETRMTEVRFRCRISHAAYNEREIVC